MYSVYSAVHSPKGFASLAAYGMSAPWRSGAATTMADKDNRGIRGIRGKQKLSSSENDLRPPPSDPWTSQMTSDLRPQTSLRCPRPLRPKPSAVCGICFITGTLGQGGAERQLSLHAPRPACRRSNPSGIVPLTQGEFWEEPIRAPRSARGDLGGEKLLASGSPLAHR